MSDAPFLGVGDGSVLPGAVLGVSVTLRAVFWVLRQLFEAQLSPIGAQKVGDGEESVVSSAVGALEGAEWR